MRRFAEAVGEILKGISDAMEKVDPENVEDLVKELIRAHDEGRRVLVVGAGRSSLVGRAFAMRLMHLGINVYVLGETINPSVADGDIALVISGSGSTALPVTVAEMAKKLGVRVLAVTSNPESPLGKLADLTVVVPGRSKAAREDEYHSRQLLGEHESLTPMGTLFENSAMVFLDSLIVELMDRLGVSEDEMKRRHAAIE
ncbi:MAG: 6-phospho-3-hexuloisomerase [Candidatus Bathyarchaeota archaeon]|jgi:6-phospho-3-hexuloisomerase|nr:6-phospho-3-hexuloisomerase [Candidatus Bathyarchaeota archaeon]MDH5791104.1 6-phospho-3-hexuloisomerase [Candidatus Bathyarchaeota archaeon]